MGEPGLFPTIRISYPNFSPIELTRLEISQLASMKELHPLLRLGGLLTEADLQENERRAAAYTAKAYEIIARHGVVDEYLAPLHAKERELVAELADVRKEIEELNALKQ